MQMQAADVDLRPDFYKHIVLSGSNLSVCVCVHVALGLRCLSVCLYVCVCLCVSVLSLLGGSVFEFCVALSALVHLKTFRRPAAFPRFFIFLFSHVGRSAVFPCVCVCGFGFSLWLCFELVGFSTWLVCKRWCGVVWGNQGGGGKKAS